MATVKERERERSNRISIESSKREKEERRKGERNGIEQHKNTSRKATELKGMRTRMMIVLQDRLILFLT